MHTYQNLLQLTYLRSDINTRFPFRSSGLHTNLSNLRALKHQTKHLNLIHIHKANDSIEIQLLIKPKTDAYIVIYSKGS